MKSYFGGSRQQYAGIPIFADPAQALKDVRETHRYATEQMREAEANHQDIRVYWLQEERKRLVRIAEEIKRQI